MVSVFIMDIPPGLVSIGMVGAWHRAGWIEGLE